MKLVLDLPLPPSTNKIWKINKGGRGQRIAEAYGAWKRECGMVLLANALVRWRGAFHIGDVEVAIDLDQALRPTRGDCDNRCKATLDLLAEVGILSNDKQVRRVSIGWADTGGVPCRVSVARSADILAGQTTMHVIDPRWRAKEAA